MSDNNNQCSSNDSDQANDQDWLDPVFLRTHFNDKSIMVGVSGGIAVYKVCTIVSRLAQAGANVTVAMTPAATKFVTPITFQALSGNPVYTTSWEHIESQDPQHISLADRCDAVLVAPCTMNTLANLVQGRTDDVLTLILSAVDRKRVPVVLAPAMNDAMWSQPSNLRNVELAVTDGFTLVGPGVGWQACRHSGTGRMSEPADCLKALQQAMKE
ncbi:MAG: flavoprotein [Phycisphaerales bacterium]|nr:flavoprotein [Phycisphaerales bacterium]